MNTDDECGEPVDLFVWRNAEGRRDGRMAVLLDGGE
jgi:hypothetical protein